MSSQSSHHPQVVLLAHVHTCCLKPHSFYFIFAFACFFCDLPNQFQAQLKKTYHFPQLCSIQRLSYKPLSIARQNWPNSELRLSQRSMLAGVLHHQVAKILYQHWLKASCSYDSCHGSQYKLLRIPRWQHNAKLGIRFQPLFLFLFSQLAY